MLYRVMCGHSSPNTTRKWLTAAFAAGTDARHQYRLQRRLSKRGSLALGRTTTRYYRLRGPQVSGRGTIQCLWSRYKHWVVPRPGAGTSSSSAGMWHDPALMFDY
jgi:hypothetical protein